MRFTCFDRSSRTDRSTAFSRAIQTDTLTFKHRRKHSHLPLADSGKFNDLQKRTSVKKCMIEREKSTPQNRIDTLCGRVIFELVHTKRDFGGIHGGIGYNLLGFCLLSSKRKPECFQEVFVTSGAKNILQLISSRRIRYPLGLRQLRSDSFSDRVRISRSSPAKVVAEQTCIANPRDHCTQ